MDPHNDVTNRQIVCNYHEGRAEPNRIRLSVGGDKINHPNYYGTPIADLLMVKLLLNNIVSMPNATFMTMNIKNFYLNMPLSQYLYLQC